MSSDQAQADADLGALRRSRPETREQIPHPPRKWASRIVVPAVVLIGFAALLAYAFRDALVPRTPVSVVPVVVKTAAGGAPAGAVVATAAGWIEPGPFPTYVSALTDGVVQEVLVLEGDAVEAGQVVARLVPDDARLAQQRARADLADAQAQLANGMARRTAAQTDWDNPVEVTRAAAAAKAMLDEARASVLTAQQEVVAQQARVEELSEQLRREEQVVSSGAVSEFTVVQTRLRRATAQAQLEALQARVPASEAVVAERASMQRAADENLRLRTAERRELASAKAEVDRRQAEVERAQAVLAEADLRMSRVEIRSPVDGLVMRRLVAVGDKLMMAMDAAQSAHAVHLYDPTKLQVRVDVALADMAGVGVGQDAQIVVEVLPDRVFKGVVARIVHEADIQKNTVQVKVAIIDPDPALKPEMLARVQVLGGGEGADPAAGAASSKERVFAPTKLLHGRSGRTAHAWVVDKTDNTLVRREVTLGTGREGDWIEVSDGLRPGDTLVDADPADLAVGQRVAPRAASPAASHSGGH